jgi:zinc protease
LNLPLANASTVTNCFSDALECFTFDHGLKLIHHETPGTGVVAIDVWVKAGSVYETDDWSGMAHFLEHMIFKGSDRIVPGEFDQAVEGHGGFANAATSYDYAHYFMVMATQHLSRTLPYLSEILLNAAIPDEEFDPERQVVFEELRQAWDNPDYVGFETLNQLMYQQHHYRRPILGTPETLSKFTPQMMRQFHRSRYQPENMTVIVVGDVAFEQAIDEVGKTFAQFAKSESLPLVPAITEPPLLEMRREVLCLPTIEQSRVMLAWLTPGWQAEMADPLRTGYILDVISVILTGGRTSRLVQELVEQRELAYGVDASFSLQRDSGLFTLTAWLEQAEVERVEAIFADRIAALANVPIPERELNRVKRLLCNEQAYSIETPDQLAGLYGYYDLMGWLGRSGQYAAQIRSITAAEIQQVAAAYLSPYRYGAVVMQEDSR